MQDKHGGGGRGGHSIAVAYEGAAPDLGGVLSVDRPATPAQGGDGGQSSAQGNPGEPGISSDAEPF